MQALSYNHHRVHIDLGSAVFQHPQDYSWQELDGTMDYCETWLHGIADKLADTGSVDPGDYHRLCQLKERFIGLRNQAALMASQLDGLSSTRRYAAERQLDMLFADMVVVVREAESISEGYYGPLKADWPEYERVAKAA